MRRTNLPARFPPHGAWPALMRADMTAAFFDFDDTAALYRAIARGEAPQPTEIRHRGQAREPVWSADICRDFANRHYASEGASDAGSVAGFI